MTNDPMLDDAYNDLPENNRYTVQDALRALQAQQETIASPAVVFGFSNVLQADLEAIRPDWLALPADRRRQVMQHLAEVSEVDFSVDYNEFARLGYADPDHEVRLAAIQAGWADESLETMHHLMDMATRDALPEVRAAAIQQLGKFIYLGEVEDLNHENTVPVEELALRLHEDNTQSLDVQRRALEALSHCSRPGIIDLIKRAYTHPDLPMKVSAINAMGNTCDAMWSQIILAELDSEQPQIVFEAVRAAGAVGVREAVEKLSDFVYSDDREIQEAAIWALGEIGGEKAVDILTQLEAHAEDAGDEELSEAIEEALGMATIMTDIADDFDMLVYEDDEDDEDDDLDAYFD
ncbi:MAG: hypothetical protein HC915_00155 [Anaerolineae bacterium]|nr:hypothetical protein [Anaerolineae bacterium]